MSKIITRHRNQIFSLNACWLLLLLSALELLPTFVLGFSSIPIIPRNSPKSSTTFMVKNNRHVCLFDDYEAVRGPHFFALFDQLWEQTGHSTNKRVAYITFDNNEIEKALATLQEELDLEVCHHISLAKFNNDPTKLRQVLLEEQDQPYSIVWIASSSRHDDDNNENAFLLRHGLRVSGVDTIVGELCGPGSNKKARLFVGEGTGVATCAGASMAVAQLRGDDPTAAPELQFRGMELLGPSRCIYIGPENKQEHPLLKQKLSKLAFYDENEHSTLFLNYKQVYVYSQQQGGDTTSLVMNPYQKGAIEQYESSSLEPVPPMVFDDDDDAKAATSTVSRPCTGEPSEDPSRTIYLNQVEEGDYW